MTLSYNCVLRIRLLILSILSISIITVAQPPIQWQKCLGGSNDDNSRCIRQTKDGGFISAGSTISNNGDVTHNNGFVDYWVVKQHADGSIQWQKSLGGSSSDVAYSVEQTKDGGYIVTGYAESNDGLVINNHGYTDFWVTRLDENGNLIWQKALGGSYHDNGHSILQTSDGGFIVAGGVSSADGDVVGKHDSFDGWVVRLDAKGAVLWSKCYGGNGIDDIDAISQAPDGGYIMTGYSLSTDGDFSFNHGGGDLWVIKTDGAGNIQWQKTLGGSEIDAGKKVVSTSDGGYIVTGLTKSSNGDVSNFHGDFDIWVVKLNAVGNLQWQRCYGGSSLDAGVSIISTTDNGYIIGGQSASTNGDVTGNHGNLDYLLVKINSVGAVLWQKCYGGSGSDMMSDLVPTSDGWFAASGSTTSQGGDVSGIHGLSYDFWIVKFGPDPKCTPAINIEVSQNNICMGTPVSFKATLNNGGTNAIYRWKKNNTVVGTNNGTYIPDALREGDVVLCEYSCKTACDRDTTIVSNSIKMTVINDVMPEVTITASATTICEGTEVRFTATPFFGNMTPSYQWLVNGSPAGANSTFFSSVALPANAQVQCLMTISTAVCPGTTKDYSNIISVAVLPITSPEVKLSASTQQICKGGSITFTATGNGGTNPSYHWKINGTATANTSASFSTTTLLDGDKVSCTMNIDPSAKCLSESTAVSNTVSIKVSEATLPALNITPASVDVCSGTAVAFTAVLQNSGIVNAYQWQVNAENVTTNTATYVNDRLKSGDKVTCILTAADLSCPATVTANVVNVVVREVPVITFPQSELAIMAGQQARLPASVTGTIASHQWRPASNLIDPQTLSPTTRPITANATFNLKVVATNGCEASKDVVVSVLHKLYMPTAFTPNNDGKNDVFRIPSGTSIQLTEFAVFDRWGNKIFSTSDAGKGWDGTYKGRVLDSGTFVYFIKGKSENREVLLKGTVILIH